MPTRIPKVTGPAHGRRTPMNTVNALPTPLAAYAAAPQQGGFAPPGAVELPEPEQIPRDGEDASGEPPPDLLGGSNPGSEDVPDPGSPPDQDQPGAYGADGLLTRGRGVVAGLDLLAV